jgi:predicted dehydrogenase
VEKHFGVYFWTSQKSKTPPMGGRIPRKQDKKTMKLRIGLIGLGDAWQSRHRPALRVLQNRFDVRAVYSPVAKLAENAASEFQADAVDGYRALVARCDIDAVMVLTRTWQQWLPVLAAAKAGKAIYWAADLDFHPQADRSVRSEIDESGVAFMVEFPRRYAPATLRLRELIATRLGPPKLVICRRRLKDTEGSTIKPAACRSDPLTQEMIELIDWCRYVIAREPASVTSSGSVSSDGTEYQSLSLDFPATVDLPAVTAQLASGNYIRPSWQEAIGFRPPSGMEICCQRGVAFIDLPSSLVWFDDAGRHVESLETEMPVGEQLLTQFHRAVTSLVRNSCELRDVFRAATILDAARTSEREGRRIDV